MQISTQVSQTRLLSSFSWTVQGSPESMEDHLNLWRITWIYGASDNSCPSYTEVAEEECGLALWYSVLQGSKDDWPTDTAATWTNWYSCPLPSPPRTSKTFFFFFFFFFSSQQQNFWWWHCCCELSKALGEGDEIWTAWAGLRAFEREGTEH